MDRKQFSQESWEDIREKVQAIWTSFSDDEFDRVRGNYNQLSLALQKKYGLSPQETNRKLEELLSLHTDTEGRNTQNANREHHDDFYRGVIH